MSCVIIENIIEKITEFNPVEFAPIFIDILTEVYDICPNEIIDTFIFLKENYNEYYIQIMIMIGKGG